ncbi:NCS1 family nucleobase:cation symporter-1 [Kocuria turfanensis]|uniref:Nitrate reductase n=1 Tax=Kocuria turfanensis TaxID=388357 RepID=A0A512IBV5_9MICC|nr:NCS1 family nucleobase:cation symporter-1 [Kocuria turfanensis]GEO95182.1 nitrate reductase [Kocuria turfanensis]
MTVRNNDLSDAALAVHTADPSLYNEDLAPLPASRRTWGWFAIFNVWSNDIQSLAGYTLAASLFITAGINGWFVFAAILLAGFIVKTLVDLSGRPSVKYGFPYPVLARASMGVRGAQFPAIVRAVVAIFWYGAQTYFASTAIALALNAVLGNPGGPQFLGMDAISWISYVVASGLQIALFLGGIERIANFLNIAGPAVYLVMIALLVAIWAQLGSELPGAVATVFSRSEVTGWAAVSAFAGVTGTMIAYFAAVVINFGDFARNVRTERAMRFGNFTGLPLSLALFTFLSVFITAGAYLLYQDGRGEPLTNPTDIVAAVDNVPLTVLAAVTFLVATLGINVVANFIPPSYSLSNIDPARISFRRAGVITAITGFVIGALWVAVISTIGLPKFVDTLGAVLAPLYGIIIADYYLVRKQRLNLQDLYSADPGGCYWFTRGWNRRAVVAFAVAAVFSVLTVWLPQLAQYSGFAWLSGAALGGLLHWLAMHKVVVRASHDDI